MATATISYMPGVTQFYLQIQSFQRLGGSTDEKFTAFYWSLQLQCIFSVYKGFCWRRDWQLLPVSLWISPCIIEYWYKISSPVWSLCYLKCIQDSTKTSKNTFAITWFFFYVLKPAASKQITQVKKRKGLSGFEWIKMLQNTGFCYLVGHWLLNK